MREQATQPAPTTEELAVVRSLGPPPKARPERSSVLVSPPAPPTRRALLREGLWVYALFQLLTIPFVPALQTTRDTIYNDVVIGWFGPEKHGAAQFVRSLFLPTWTRDQFGGEPFLANIQHALFYPGNLPFWLLPTSWALKVVAAIHLAFAGVGMWAYCRVALRASRWGSLVAGLAYGFGAMALSHIILLNQLEVLAWMPVVLLFAHLALETGRLRYVVLTAVSVGLQFLGGHPEEWVYTLVALAFYGLAWSLAGPWREWPRRALAGAARLGGAVALFALLFGWQLLPTLLLQRNGYRAGPGFDQQYPLPRNLAFNALLPDYVHMLPGENCAVIGIVTLALAGLGIAVGTRRLRWVRWWMLAMAAFGIVMALGNSNAVYRFAYDHVPLVAQFRVPARYLLFFAFAMSAAASLGTDVLLHSNVGRLGHRIRQGVAGLGVLAVVFGVALAFGDVGSYGSRRGWALAALFGAGAWLLAGVRRVPRAGVAGLLLVVSAVELHQSSPVNSYQETAPNVVYDVPGPVLDTLGGEGGRYVTTAWDRPASVAERESLTFPADLDPVERNYFAITWPRHYSARPALTYATHAEAITGRDGGLLPLRRYLEFFTAAVNRDPGTRPAAGVTLQPPSAWNWDALDLLGVRWFITTWTAPADAAAPRYRGSGFLPAKEAALLGSHGFTVARRDAYFLLWERPAPPIARMQYDTDVVASESAAIARLRAGYPLLDRALVESPVGPFRRPAQAPVVRTTHVGQTTVRLTVTSSTEGLLVLADPYYPQWRATVNGRSTKVLPVDLALRGVRVPAGTSTVVFSYQDRALQTGVASAGLTSVALVALWLYRRRRGSAPARPRQLVRDIVTRDSRPGIGRNGRRPTRPQQQE